MEIVPDGELRARLADAADGAPEPDLARRLLGLVRPSIALTPTEGDACGRTRFWGLPPLPRDMEWPESGGRPLTLLAQLDCAVLHPLLGDEWPFRRHGLLLFFFDDAFDGGDRVDVRVLHVPGDAPERPAPPGMRVPAALPLAAAPTPSLPPSFGSPVGELLSDHDLIDAMDAADALHSVLPQVDHRLLGWNAGGLDEPDGHRQLLQTEAPGGADWGEIVGISYWTADEELAAGRFDNVYGVMEVA